MATFTATVQSGEVTGTHTDFPAFVDLSELPAAFWDVVSNGGGDIRVYEDEGLTAEIPREVVFCDTSTDTGELHFKVTSLSSATQIWIDVDGIRSDYGASDTYGRNAVWGDYMGVFHLNDLTTSTVSNSVGANDGTKRSANNPLEVTGKIGEAQDFVNANSDYIDANGLVSLISNNNYTASAWFNTDALLWGVRQRIIVAGSTSGYEDMALDIFIDRTSSSSGEVKVQFRDGSTGTLALVGNVPTAGSWEMVNLTRNVTAAILYQNGSSVDSGTDAEVGATSGAGFRIGGLPLGVDYFGGIIDEVRICELVRNANWIETEYNNQSDPGGFWGTWEEPIVIAPPVVEATNTSEEASATTTHTVDLPASIQADDLLLIFFRTGGLGAEHEVPSGWTLLDREETAGESSIFYKVATGSEGASVSVTTVFSRLSAHISCRISNYSGLPLGTFTDSLDPPSRAATYTGAHLWFAYADARRTSFTLALPSGYDNQITSESNAASSSTDDTKLTVGTRELETGTEDPGAIVADPPSGTSGPSFPHAATVVVMGIQENLPVEIDDDISIVDDLFVFPLLPLEINVFDTINVLEFSASVDENAVVTTAALFLRDDANPNDGVFPDAKLLSLTPGTSDVTITSAMLPAPPGEAVVGVFLSLGMGNQRLPAGDWKLFLYARLDPGFDAFSEETEFYFYVYLMDENNNLTFLDSSPWLQWVEGTTYVMYENTIVSMPVVDVGAGEQILLVVAARDEFADTQLQYRLEVDGNQSRLEIPEYTLLIPSVTVDGGDDISIEETVNPALVHDVRLDVGQQTVHIS